MVNTMVKVHLRCIRIPVYVVYLFGFKIGKYFFFNGGRYEGQYKDDKFNG